MSKRRQLGEKLLKKAGAGFTGLELKVQIPDNHTWKTIFNSPVTDNISSCMMDCGDPECREFANLMVLDKKGKPIKDDWVYHVSECQLEDLEDTN